MERKSFLNTFVNRIDLNYPTVTVEYTIPLETKKAEPSDKEVLPFASNGSGGRTRTYDLVVNSHPLCQLSYAGMKLILSNPLIHFEFELEPTSRLAEITATRSAG